MPNFTLTKDQTALLVIDVQDRMLAAVDRGQDILQTMLKVVQGFQILRLPIFISEQYPQGLGETVHPLKNVLREQYRPLIKSTFSCMDDPTLAQHLSQQTVKQWVLMGIEAHVCVLQTAKGLLNLGKQVTVLNDAMSSRSIYDFSTAIAEMRDEGVRISCTETVLFELVRDSHSPEFKPISQLVKSRCSCSCA